MLRENQQFRSPTRSDTIRSVRSKKQARTLKILDVSRRGIVLYIYSENTDADQLCSYCTADLRLCFRISRLLVFLCNGSFYFSISQTGAERKAEIKITSLPGCSTLCNGLNISAPTAFAVGSTLIAAGNMKC